MRRLENMAASLLLVVAASLASCSGNQGTVQLLSANMEPTILKGSVVAVSEFDGKAGRGDIVVHGFPWDAQQRTVSRVVGLENDKIELSGDELLVNGSPVGWKMDGSSYQLKHDAYQNPVSGRPQRCALDRRYVIVPHGHAFLVGDNPEQSLDSRHFGPVSFADIFALVTERRGQAENRE